MKRQCTVTFSLLAAACSKDVDPMPKLTGTYKIWLNQPIIPTPNNESMFDLSPQLVQSINLHDQLTSLVCSPRRKVLRRRESAQGATNTNPATRMVEKFICKRTINAKKKKVKACGETHPSHSMIVWDEVRRPLREASEGIEANLKIQTR